eukprot:COSAG02_NODE_1885_length_10515_cov_7.148522_5_plen_112_part_00
MYRALARARPAGSVYDTQAVPRLRVWVVCNCGICIYVCQHWYMCKQPTGGSTLGLQQHQVTAGPVVQTTSLPPAGAVIRRSATPSLVTTLAILCYCCVLRVGRFTCSHASS